MQLENKVRGLEARVELLAAQANPGSRVFMAGSEGDVVSQRRQALIQRRAANGAGARTNRAPLQLTARVEEISRSAFLKAQVRSSAAGGASASERGEDDALVEESLAAGRAVIVWTPDE